MFQLNLSSQWIKLPLFILAAFLPGVIGSAATTVDQWYAQLAKPAWTPPGYVFGPAWTLLYLLMGISTWVLWKQGGMKKAALPFLLYGVQLVLNALWPWLFFGRHDIGPAFFEIIILLAMAILMTMAFARHSRISAILLIPYLVWVSFAACLNYTVWMMNK